VRSRAADTVSTQDRLSDAGAVAPPPEGRLDHDGLDQPLAATSLRVAGVEVALDGLPALLLGLPPLGPLLLAATARPRAALTLTTAAGRRVSASTTRSRGTATAAAATTAAARRRLVRLQRMTVTSPHPTTVHHPPPPIHITLHI